VEGLARPAPHFAAPPAGAGGEAQGKKGDGRERG
jgi:hypothetical protein